MTAVRLVSAVLLGLGAPVRGPDLADFVQVKEIKAAQMAPDGHTIACTVAVTDLPGNRVRNQLWLVPAVGGEPKHLAPEGIESIGQALWSPDGGRLAVVGKAVPRKAGEKAETWLWVVDVESGKAWQLVPVRRRHHYLAHHAADLCWSS